MFSQKRTIGLVAALATLAIGCASGGNTPADQVAAELQEREREVANLQRELKNRESKLATTQAQLKRATTPAVSAAPPGSAPGMASGAELLPPNAKAGECFARVFVPPTFQTNQIQKLSKASSERIEIIPARYELVEEQVLVSDASTKLIEVPAVYEWTEERVLVKAAQTAWKKGRGPTEKVNDATGEIMCLVEIPAEYKTVRSKVLKTAATTRRVEVPAQYKTVKVRKLVEPAKERRIEIPAEYQTVTQREQLADGRLAWQPVLCETNINPGLVSSLQTALAEKGHNPGPIDGRIGAQTMAAVKSYQRKNNLPAGRLTLATIKSLGVEIGR